MTSLINGSNELIFQVMQDNTLGKAGFAQTGLEPYNEKWVEENNEKLVVNINYYYFYISWTSYTYFNIDRCQVATKLTIETKNCCAQQSCMDWKRLLSRETFIMLRIFLIWALMLCHKYLRFLALHMMNCDAFSQD